MNRKRKLPDSSRESDDEEPCPEWLSKLLKEENFSKMNFFCLDCCIPFCNASNHKSMKIYQYCMKKSVRLEDLDEFFDCDGVQEYKEGNKKLVYITSTKSKVLGDYTNQCRNLNCCKNLRRGKKYCSLGCKVAHCKSSLKDLIKYWGTNRVETVASGFQTSASNLNVTSIEASGSRTDAPNSNTTLDEVSGNGTTAPEPNVISNEATGSCTDAPQFESDP